MAAPLTGEGWVTELNAATGALVKVLKGPSYAFNHPTGIALDGTHVWVANGQPAKQERRAATLTQMNGYGPYLGAARAPDAVLIAIVVRRAAARLWCA